MAHSHTPPGDPSPVSSSAPASATVDDVRFVGGLAYAAPLGFRPLLLDLYLPAVGPDPAPLVVFMHGGGWLRGDRSMVGPGFAAWRPGPLARLAADGFAVASVDYRLSGEARFPAQLEDVSAAVEWLTGHAQEYGFDAGRIVLWGESAGAHLAVLLGLRLPGRRVRGVVDWYGPADLTALDEQVGAAGALTDDPLDTREARLLGAPVAEVPGLARAASPISHVRAGAPPFLIAHGTADRAVPFRQSEALAAALAEAGADVRFEAVDGADHMWVGVEDLSPLYDAMVAFAREVTGG
jgi:acetyl esterase/lipase